MLTIPGGHFCSTVITPTRPWDVLRERGYLDHNQSMRKFERLMEAEATPTTKGAIYYHCDNKEALGHAVVEEAIASNLHKAGAAFTERRGSHRWFRNVQRGCPMLTLSQEMSGIVRY
jgi:hypothetical protein